MTKILKHIKSLKTIYVPSPILEEKIIQLEKQLEEVKTQKPVVEVAQDPTNPPVDAL